VEAKESLTKASGSDAAELVERSPHSLVAQTLMRLGAPPGLRVETEWKVPAGSGISGEAPLALAIVAAVSRALGGVLGSEALIALAREVAVRAGRADDHGLHAELFGGVVLTRGHGAGLEAQRPSVDPGRIADALLVVDAGAPDPADGVGAGGAACQSGAISATGPIVEAFVRGRYEEVVELLAGSGKRAAPGRASGGWWFRTGPAARRLLGRAGSSLSGRRRARAGRAAARRSRPR
jgi:hypothetical protein